MTELRFEWDPKKNRENRRRHKVSFEEAETAFADEHGLLMAETRITRRMKIGLFFWA